MVKISFKLKLLTVDHQNVCINGKLKRRGLNKS
jgi:hypothetical protein